MHGIAIVGANGSGKTTLCRALAQELGCFSIDIEDYSFEPSEIPYEKPRPKSQVRALIAQEIKQHPAFVLSAVNGDLGAEINAYYDVIVYLHAPLETRLERVAHRSAQAFGKRMEAGGDLHAQEQAFLHFVKNRTMEKIDRWVEKQCVPVWHVDATMPTAQLVEMLAGRLKDEGYKKEEGEVQNA